MTGSQTIDVTGLPEPVIAGLRGLVDNMRAAMPGATGNPPPATQTPEERVKQWLDWVDGFRDVTAVTDDSRESIYEGR